MQHEPQSAPRLSQSPFSEPIDRLWYWALGSVSVATVTTPKVELFYWATIMFSQTLGTALGDWVADDTGLGYGGGALVFGMALAVVAGLYFYTRVSRGHRQLVELRLRWCVTGTACSWLRRSGDAGDLGPSLEGLAPGGSILGGGHLMAAKVEEVADPIVGGQEALRLAG